MPEHIQYEDDDLFNPETHHESSDVPVKGLIWFLIIFVVFSFLTYIVVLFMYKGFANMERKRMDPPRSAVARPKNADVPQNQPLLQPFPRGEGEHLSTPQGDTPVADLIKMRAHEHEVLTNYGWVDKQKGIAHIPIDEAKARFAAMAATQSQVVTATDGTSAMTTTAPASSVPAPSGQPIPADSGVAPSSNPATTPATSTAAPHTTTTTTTGGAHP